MKNTFLIALLLLISGCASTKVVDGTNADTTKESIDNMLKYQRNIIKVFTFYNALLELQEPEIKRTFYTKGDVTLAVIDYEFLRKIVDGKSVDQIIMMSSSKPIIEISGTRIE